MPRKKSELTVVLDAVQPEWNELVESVPVVKKPSKERPASEDAQIAWLYATKLYPYPVEDGDEDIFKRERNGAFVQARKHLSELCGKIADSKGYRKYDYSEVYLAWEALYEKYLSEQDTGAWKNPPTLLGV